MNASRQEYRPKFFPSGVIETLDDVVAILKFRSGGDPDNLPNCPNCHRKMQRHLSIAARTGVLDYIRSDIDLIFCWQCSAASEISYCGNLKEGIEFIDWFDDPTAQFPPFEPFPQSHPKRSIMFRPITDAEQEIHLMRIQGIPNREILQRSAQLRVDVNVVDEPAYQVGGVPYLYEMPPYECPKCGQAMKVLATTANQNGTPTGWCGGEDVVMVFQICERCQVIQASHQID